jgi:hypothetical protein
MKPINIYFKSPLTWDCLISVSIATATFKLISNKVIEVPKHDFILSSVSDIANISFSSTGFILTILTVLITFKASSRRKDKIENYDSALDFFFQTPLYAQTTYHLKNCIKSLVVLGLIDYIFKITIPKGLNEYLFCFLIFSLFILALTLMRCLLILSKVLTLQNK